MQLKKEKEKEKLPLSIIERPETLTIKCISLLHMIKLRKWHHYRLQFHSSTPFVLKITATTHITRTQYHFFKYRTENLASLIDCY